MEKLIAKIIKMDNQGRGIAYLNNKIVFVPFTLINEEVEIEIIKEHSKYIEAKLVKIIKPSAERIMPPCKYYEVCGGCSLEHLSYEDQLSLKKRQLEDLFRKSLNLDLGIIPIANPESYNYRNKISLKVENGKTGFYQNNSNKLIPIKACLIVDDDINKLLEELNGLKIKNGKITIRINKDGELLIIINSKDKISYLELTKKFKIVGIIYNDKLIYGNDYFIEEINGYKFKINYNSFFQTNNYINSELLKLLSENTPSNLNILDLFCGVGSLGISIANKSKSVIGIEIFPEAVINAEDNAKLNNISNTVFVCEDALKLKLDNYKDIDLTIVDPPRSGLNKNIINQIKSKHLIYISCDLMTLLRDLKSLNTNYKIEKIYLLDMFSYTSHVETFVKLIKK